MDASVTDLRDRYRELLGINRDIHSQAIETIPRWAMQQGARKLGIAYAGGQLKLKKEWEIHLLLQFVLYEVASKDSTVMGDHLASLPAPADDKAVVIEGIRQSFGSLFEIRFVQEDSLQLADLFDQGRIRLLMNTGLARTAAAGSLLYSRLVPVPGFHMTTGASMPFRSGEKAELLNLLLPAESGALTSAERFQRCFRLFRMRGEPAAHWTEESS